MIRLRRTDRGEWLVWGPEDVPAISRIIGPDECGNERTAYAPAVLLAARRAGIPMSAKLQRRLDQEEALRNFVRRIRKHKDVSPDDLLEHDLDPSITETLFPHQRVALAFMMYVDAYLLRDQPGVGKTPVAILWAQHRSTRRVLVITPNSAKYQWADEIVRWSQGSLWTNLPQRIAVIDGTIKEQNKIAAESDGWVIGHWEALVHASDGILERDWDTVILDEAHAIRNRKTQRADIAHVLGRFTPHRLALTAHPYVKSPDELYSLLRFVRPDQYNSFWRFFSMHVLAKPKIFGGFEVKGTRSPKLLRWELSPFTIGRKKKDVFKTVPVTRIPRYLTLPRKYRADYERLRKEFFAELEGRDKRLPILNVLSRTTRLRQYVVDPGLLGSTLPSLKYPIIAELLEEVDGALVVFTSFAQAAVRLNDFLRKRKYRTSIIAGKINGRKQKPRERQDIQRRFHAGEYDATIIVTAAGREALNFGKYGYVAYLDLPWTAMELEQTEGRVDRPDATTGQIVHTTAYRLVTHGTYEEKIEQKIEKTFAGFNEVFDPKELRTLF